MNLVIIVKCIILSIFFQFCHFVIFDISVISVIFCRFLHYNHFCYLCHFCHFLSYFTFLSFLSFYVTSVIWKSRSALKFIFILVVDLNWQQTYKLEFHRIHRVSKNPWIQCMKLLLREIVKLEQNHHGRLSNAGRFHMWFEMSTKLNFVDIFAQPISMMMPSWMTVNDKSWIIWQFWRFCLLFVVMIFLATETRIICGI